ncbi:MAG: hypothetical protein JNK65_01750, partial [Deltaproteobacteria bacterium]|nr:hypothetical protein [Deltaproteobacteria bacterium]
MIQAVSFGILSAFNSSMPLSLFSIFAKSPLSLDGFSDSKKTPISQKPSSQNFPSKPALELAKLEKRLSSSIQYLHGFSDGLNPLTSIADTLQELLHLERPTSLNSPSYWKGRENGSQLGMFIDTAGMTGGTALMASSIQCATTTLGGCLPIAGPGAGAGLTALGLGTALMVSHSKNFEKSQAPPINENRS